MQGQDFVLTPSKKHNQLFHSRYFSRSERVIDNPQKTYPLFRQKPLEKYYRDIAILSPVSYRCPDSSILDRSYVVVDENVVYGRPLSQAELEDLRNKKRAEPEVVTWGRCQKDLKPRVKAFPREHITFQRESVNGFGCWCCGPTKVDEHSVLVDRI